MTDFMPGLKVDKKKDLQEYNCHVNCSTLTLNANC